METLKEERDAVRHYLGGDARWQEEPPAHVHETAIGALNDADRLARLEDGIRALADNLAEEVDSHSPNKSFDEYGGGCADKAEQIEQELRALLDGE